MLDEILLLFQGAAVPVSRQIHGALVEHAQYAAQAFKVLALVDELELLQVADVFAVVARTLD